MKVRSEKEHVNNGRSPLEAQAMHANAMAKVKSLKIKEIVTETEEVIIELNAGEDENGAIRAFMNSTSAYEEFEYAEPNWGVWPTATCTSDAKLPEQWHHDNMKSCDAWDLHTGSPSVTIAICDTGIRTDQEDLELNRLEGYNAITKKWENSGGEIGVMHWHGTACTGCAAGNGNNGIGIAGMGWNLSHRMFRVTEWADGYTDLATLTHAAITACNLADVKVASVSYSGVQSSSVRSAGTHCKSQGSLLFWAAGNNGANLNWGNR